MHGIITSAQQQRATDVDGKMAPDGDLGLLRARSFKHSRGSTIRDMVLCFDPDQEADVDYEHYQGSQCAQSNGGAPSAVKFAPKLAFLRQFRTSLVWCYEGIDCMANRRKWL